MMQLRVVKPDERPSQPEDDGLQRLESIMHIPYWMFERPDHANITREAVTYECPIHGVIEPRAFANGYRRRECPCQWERRQVESVQRYQDAIQHALGIKQAEHCYTWLGKDAQEIGLEAKTFGNFDYKLQPDAYKTAINYNPRSDPRNLVFMGSVGTGKTHLVAAILNGLRAQGISCLFATVPTLFDAYYAANFDGKLSIIEQFGSTEVAALDDVDKLHVKPETDGKYQKEVLYKIFNRRYVRGLPTLLTTNAQESLAQWMNEATLDRLYERCEIVPMNGKSYRRVLAEQHKNGG